MPYQCILKVVWCLIWSFYSATAWRHLQIRIVLKGWSFTICLLNIISSRTMSWLNNSRPLTYDIQMDMLWTNSLWKYSIFLYNLNVFDIVKSHPISPVMLSTFQSLLHLYSHLCSQYLLAIFTGYFSVLNFLFFAYSMDENIC